MNAKIYNPIPLILSQSAAGSHGPHMATLGVPFAEGLVQNCDGFAVVTPDGVRVPAAVRATANWPGGTVKWGLVKFLCTNISAENSGYLLVNNSNAQSALDSCSGFSVERTNEAILINDDTTEYRFPVTAEQVFPIVSVAKKQVWSAGDSNLRLFDETGQQLAVKKISTELVQHDSVSALVDVVALVESAKNTTLNMLFRFEVIRGQVLSLTTEVHNPNRANHPDGIWDLGDSNSFRFKEISLLFNRRDTDRIDLRPEPGVDSVTLDSDNTATLFQASSGGENWDSPTHVNAQGISCNQFCGYTLELDQKAPISGKRASPVVRFQREEQVGFVIKLREFWQNFPKSLVLTEKQFAIGLFPAEHTDGYELQGGERKRHEIVFSFTSDNDALNWLGSSSTIKAEPNVVEQAGVLLNTAAGTFEPYDRLISVSLSDSKGLFAKRENQDEYGWRHYGDVVADHETLYHDSDEIFVSHYNNQYDAIYGFARQYLLTSDPRWFQLMDDLARHVLDIDIYRTTKDRAEYNHGLFWHTDHYLQAFTCSHRTYSKGHYTEGWSGNKGGGPGPEHCYTTGLKLYYHITGNEDAREAVLGLASWIRYYYEGTGTLVERCKRLLSRDRHDLIAVLKGHQVFRYRYSFDRGVGNYIRALLDSYDLTLDETYLLQTEAIIMNTFGSRDDFSLRNLDDVEFTWFYTVFLQEVIRYLDLKRDTGSFDDAFCYARDALLHYAHWMAVHETPALESTKPLEFANDTWIAQDIRKANILYSAYRYETENRQPLLSRAREFRDYVTDKLAKSETLHFARIQIILLQNHGPSALMDSPVEPYDGLLNLQMKESSDRQCFHTRASFFVYLLSSIWQDVKKFSLTREISWIKTRLG